MCAVFILVLVWVGSLAWVCCLSVEGAWCFVGGGRQVGDIIVVVGCLCVGSNVLVWCDGWFYGRFGVSEVHGSVTLYYDLYSKLIIAMFLYYVGSS